MYRVNTKNMIGAVAIGVLLCGFSIVVIGISLATNPQENLFPIILLTIWLAYIVSFLTPAIKKLVSLELVDRTLTVFNHLTRNTRTINLNNIKGFYIEANDKYGNHREEIILVDTGNVPILAIQSNLINNYNSLRDRLNNTAKYLGKSPFSNFKRRFKYVI